MFPPLGYALYDNLDDGSISYAIAGDNHIFRTTNQLTFDTIVNRV
jgi:hypothetical protein